MKTLLLNVTLFALSTISTAHAVECQFDNLGVLAAAKEFILNVHPGKPISKSVRTHNGDTQNTSYISHEIVGITNFDNSSRLSGQFRNGYTCDLTRINNLSLTLIEPINTDQINDRQKAQIRAGQQCINHLGRAQSGIRISLKPVSGKGVGAVMSVLQYVPAERRLAMQINLAQADIGDFLCTMNENQ